MRRALIPIVAILSGVTIASSAPKPSYLFLWAGDSAGKASDFLAVIDATPSSAHYGAIVASVSTGVAGEHPHHTEAEMPANGLLLANGFHAGRTWLFDLSQPLHPRILGSFGDVAGYSHPHTFVRLANGHVLTTFQYHADSGEMSHDANAHAAMIATEHTTGGLVELEENGQPVRSGAASDTTIPDKRIYPYSVLPIPAFDLAVSTTTDMDQANEKATSEWVQLWRLSDLHLLQSIQLEPGPRGDENRFTGEPRLLPDGKSVYIHTFSCGLYLLRGAERGKPTATFVMAFQGVSCGVPILTRHFRLQTVPEAHALIALDIADPEHPRELSRLAIGDDEQPHWIAMDPTGRRVVLNSSGKGTGNRLYIVNFDPRDGHLTFDDRFRDANGQRPGISLTGKRWPHGFAGTAVPHGTVFSR